MKFWKISDSKRNKLILIKDNTIYKGNPKSEDLSKLNEATTNLDFVEKLFSIPYSYIKEIQNQQGKNEIKIYFGNDSEEELIIKDKNTKAEVFAYLREELPKFSYCSELPSVFKYAKALWFALLFTTGIFIWSMYLALEIENGAQYEIIGSGRGIAGIVLFIANFGSVKIISGYLVLLAIIALRIFTRLKSRSETEFLKR
jgi:hypothetical protein